MSGRRAMKSATTLPSRAPLDRHRSRVVGEQVGPALDVVGEREDELRRGVDLDGDLAVHGVDQRAGVVDAEVERVPGELAEVQPARLRRSSSSDTCRSSRPARRAARRRRCARDTGCGSHASDAAVVVVEHAVDDADEALELADVAGLLGRARAGRAASGGSPNSRPPPGSVQMSPTPTDGAMWQSRIRSGVVAGDGVGGDPRPVVRRVRRHARRVGVFTARAAPRGSADPGRGRRERGRPSRDPSSHGRPVAWRAVGRRTRTAPAGRGTPGPARRRRPWRRTGGASRGRRRRAASPCERRSSSAARIAPRGELGRHERAMEPLAGERVEEPDRVPDEEPARAGPPRDPDAERRRARDRVAAPAGPPRPGSSPGGRDGGDDRLGDAGRAVASPAGRATTARARSRCSPAVGTGAMPT